MYHHRRRDKLNSKLTIRISKDWNFPDIKRQTFDHTGVWEDVHFTEEEIGKVDLLICLNRPHKSISIKARETWLMSQESPVDIYEWHTDSFKYFDKVFSFWDKTYGKNIISTQTALPWHVGLTYDKLKVYEKEDCKNKQNRVSWVTSNASHKPGHKLRMQFKDFLQEKNFDFDLFGRGFNPIEDKFNGIFPYKYSIAIENDITDDYWTEKISDCFLSYTIPVYYGARKITEYFPKESMLLIDPDKPEEALEIIKQAAEENYWEKNFEALEEARNLVLEKYQFFPWVVKLINDYNIRDKKIKRYYIPENDPNNPKSFKTKMKDFKKLARVRLRNFINV